MIALEITDLLKDLDDDVIAFRLVALYHALLLFCFLFHLRVRKPHPENQDVVAFGIRLMQKY